MPPILSYTVKQLDQFPRGYYRLRFSNIHIYDPTITAESGFIALGATATELLAVLSKVDGLGSVLIERKVLQMCGTLVVYRCSDDSEFGFGYTYQLSLIDILVVLTVLRTFCRIIVPCDYLLLRIYIIRLQSLWSILST
jgi:hypothetical protein